ncbi:hypothetical protein PoB_000511000 [Plakobranchus ocellatus]|uniref:Uncharacterized protein n=1 Tax=Plakobranchus ocellatus TaxID=259542 RepID=A0AAV3Y670_9GAST|nr:hypothetical protein PoB_000511000 [Plakobranchus ocellatus]
MASSSTFTEKVDPVNHLEDDFFKEVPFTHDPVMSRGMSGHVLLQHNGKTVYTYALGLVSLSVVGLIKPANCIDHQQVVRASKLMFDSQTLCDELEEMKNLGII